MSRASTTRRPYRVALDPHNRAAIYARDFLRRFYSQPALDFGVTASRDGVPGRVVGFTPVAVVWQAAGSSDTDYVHPRSLEVAA